MKIYFLRTIILLTTFFVAFLFATVFFDTIERHSGYYDQGIQDSASVYERYSCSDCAAELLCYSEKECK